MGRFDDAARDGADDAARKRAEVDEDARAKQEQLRLNHEHLPLLNEIGRDAAEVLRRAGVRPGWVKGCRENGLRVPGARLATALTSPRVWHLGGSMALSADGQFIDDCGPNYDPGFVGYRPWRGWEYLPNDRYPFVFHFDPPTSQWCDGRRPLVDTVAEGVRKLVAKTR